MTKWIIKAAIAFAVFSPNGIAQSKSPLIGTWKLVSAKNAMENGEVSDAYGQNPTGFFDIYG